VNNTTLQKLARRKSKIQRRLSRRGSAKHDRPVFSASNILYEVADRSIALGAGGIGALHLMAKNIGLPQALDQALHLLKFHFPYHESDHVLNIAYNILAGGTCLEDLELRRNDEAYLNALGAARVPDPTTAGDFCRRFTDESSLLALIETLNDVRLRVWKQQPAEFFDKAVIEADGTMAPTGGWCKEGIGLSYTGAWGYHPLLISLANTKEPLYLINRPGNRPSHEQADVYLDKALELCRKAGFKQIVFRGDTDFEQTAKLDGWDAEGVVFYFGADARKPLIQRAEALGESAWRRLERPAKYEVKTTERQKPENVRQRIVEEAKFKDLVLDWEDVAEFEHQPKLCKKPYRMIALRKKVGMERGQERLFEEYRYFIFITNDRECPAEEVVLQTSDRCDQENLIAQLKGGVRSMQNPLDNLFSNWAYMVMSSLAWTLKAWCGLLLPTTPGAPAETHRRQKREIVKMEFKSFVNAMMRLPCQIVKTSRRIIYRLLAWNPWASSLVRLAQAMRQPLRC
jgi:hypothetical protein